MRSRTPPTSGRPSGPSSRSSATTAACWCAPPAPSRSCASWSRPRPRRWPCGTPTSWPPSWLSTSARLTSRRNPRPSAVPTRRTPLLGLVAYVRHRRLRRAGRGASDRARGAPASRVPGIRLRGRRRARRWPRRSSSASGKLAELEALLASDGRPTGIGGDGAHALGHPRCADRPQRPSAPRLHGQGRGDPQRHHRELPGAAGPAREGTATRSCRRPTRSASRT